MEISSLHWIDIVIIVVSVGLSLVMGFWFAHRQKDTDTYYKASGNIPAWAVGLSMFATIISSVTFLAYPASGYVGNWILLVQGLMVPIVLVCVLGFIVPLYRKMIRLSTYEYFERRFGPAARIYSSIAFILGRFSRLGTVLYLLAMAMTMFIGGLDIRWVIITIGLVVTIMTYCGGMEAIVWMDVIQGILLIVGGLLAVGMLFWLMPGGVPEIFSIAREYHKIDFGPYDADLTQLTFLVMVLNGVFYALQQYGTDQGIVQRYLTARTDHDAKRASYIGILLSVPTWTLFMFIGTCLFAYYHANAGALPEEIRSDEVFPYFIATEMPVGITGLIIASLIAGAISTLDADINCLSALVVEDYYSRFRKNVTDRQKMRVGRVAIIIVGVAAMLIAMQYVAWGGEGVLGTLFGLYAIFSAGIVGIFVLGLFSRRANWKGLYIGIAAAIIFTAYAVLTTTHYSGTDELILNLGDWNFTHHKYMLGVYSHLIVLVVGYVASLFFKEPLADKDLTVYGYYPKA